MCLQLVMDINLINPKALLKAHNDGIEWAKTLRVGQPFMGASPQAAAHGYLKNSPEHKMFVYGALEVLDTLLIHTDDEGRITKL